MVVLLNAAFMLLAALLSLPGGLDGSLGIMLPSALITVLIGLPPILFTPAEKEISHKEGYVVVVGAWLASCVVAMIPYMLWGGEFTLGKAWFETVSGYTTTGATILNDVETLPRGILLWRSFTHWIGGAGVVMFALLVMPMLGRSRMMVSSVEMSAVAKDDFRYRSRTIVRIMLGTYLGLTLACLAGLKLTGMNWFDATNHAMSTIATGGFSTKNMSIGWWDNPAIETVLIVFMFLSSLHFGVLFATLNGRRNNIFRSEVVRYFFFFLVAAIVVIAVSTTFNGSFATFGEAFRRSAFEVVSHASTTGFTSNDPNLWGSFAVTILLLVGIQCACAGSTGGGIKADRMLLAFKTIRHQILKQQHPYAVIRIKINGVTQEQSTISFVMLFIFTYFIALIIGTVFISAYGYSTLTSFSIAATSMGNMGPAFGELGGFDNFSSLPGGVRMASSLMMLLGRLEIFGLLQIFLLKWWK
jgi:trk system potassium uptake protein TrkH